MTNTIEPISHIRARAIVQAAFAKVLNRPATRTEALFTQAWALVESTYGQGWKGSGEGSNNWGAIQTGGSWDGEKFLTRDTSPQPDGTNKPYEAYYRAYETSEAGAEDLVRVLYVGKHRGCLELATRGDLRAFVWHLRATTYFEGRGATLELQTWHREWQMLTACIRIGHELHELLSDGETPPPTFRDGGPIVDPRQSLVRKLGHDSVRSLQDASHPALTRREMPVDGVCGPATWALVFLRAREEIDRDTIQTLDAPSAEQLALEIGALSNRLHRVLVNG